MASQNKQLTASDMGKLGNRAMLEAVLREHLHIDKEKYSKADYHKAREWVGRQNARRKGEARGGRPSAYLPCTHYKQTDDNPRHRFLNGVCKCGQKKNPKLAIG